MEKTFNCKIDYRWKCGQQNSLLRNDFKDLSQIHCGIGVDGTFLSRINMARGPMLDLGRGAPLTI